VHVTSGLLRPQVRGGNAVQASDAAAAGAAAAGAATGASAVVDVRLGGGVTPADITVSPGALCVLNGSAPTADGGAVAAYLCRNLPLGPTTVVFSTPGEPAPTPGELLCRVPQ
jgi:hypothetical protein